MKKVWTHPFWHDKGCGLSQWLSLHRGYFGRDGVTGGWGGGVNFGWKYYAYRQRNDPITRSNAPLPTNRVHVLELVMVVLHIFHQLKCECPINWLISLLHNCIFLECPAHLLRHKCNQRSLVFGGLGCSLVVCLQLLQGYTKRHVCLSDTCQGNSILDWDVTPPPNISKEVARRNASSRTRNSHSNLITSLIGVIVHTWGGGVKLET